MARAQAALQWRLLNLRYAACLALDLCFGVRRLDAAFLTATISCRITRSALTEKREPFGKAQGKQAPALPKANHSIHGTSKSRGIVTLRVGENSCPKMKKAGEESPAVEAQCYTQLTIHLMLGLRQAKLSDGCGHFRLARHPPAIGAESTVVSFPEERT